jgi:hypothetical protein
MLIPRLTLPLLVLAASPAFAHPGHGKPGSLHSHTWAQLADWLANGALVFFLVFAVGIASWALGYALRRRP